MREPKLNSNEYAINKVNGKETGRFKEYAKILGNFALSGALLAGAAIGLTKTGEQESGPAPEDTKVENTLDTEQMNQLNIDNIMKGVQKGGDGAPIKGGPEAEIPDNATAFESDENGNPVPVDPATKEAGIYEESEEFRNVGGIPDSHEEPADK